MAINPLEYIYTGGKLEAANPVFGGIWTVSGTLISVYIKVQNATGVSPSYFNLLNNGVGIFAGTGRLAVSASDIDDEKTGLSIAVTAKQDFRLDLESLASGNISGPIKLLMLVDDGIADIPTGGTTGQALVKSSDSDYAIEWGTVSGGGASELDDLTDVDLTTPPTDGQALVYDSGDSVFKAGTVSGSGDVVGPASAIDNGIVLFDSTTGKLVKDSAKTISTDGTLASNSDAKVPTEKAVKTYVDGLAPIEPIGVAVSDETTDLTTGTAKVTFRMPYAFELTEVRANVNTAPTGATITVDINEGGSSILSTKLTIDATEKTSETASAAAVISDTSLADDAEMTIDIDQVGSSTKGKGLKVWLIGRRTI